MTEKRKQRPWSAEARRNHAEGVKRYQKELQEDKLMHDLCEVARVLDVEPKPLALTLCAIGKEKYDQLCSIEPLEERIKTFHSLVIETNDRIEKGLIENPLTRIRAEQTAEVTA